MLEPMTRLVGCPECGALFRHSPRGGAQRGRCSRCRSVFPLADGAMSYRVVPAPGAAPPRAVTVGPRPPATPMTIGMDDPTLAERVRRSGLDVEPGQPRRPLTYRVVAGETAGEPAPDPATMAEAPEEASAEPAPEVAAEAAEAAAAPARGAGRVAKTAMVLACCGLGAAAGFLLSADLAQDPRVGAATGAAAGLVAAWGWLRWISRNG